MQIYAKIDRGLSRGAVKALKQNSLPGEESLSHTELCILSHRKVEKVPLMGKWEKQAKELTDWGRVLMTPASFPALLSD